ncbi:hypothetical protein H9W95_00845 [Flavobacterium lindanitolerans]|nr:hypothetical protein [Flavobacterium lindanitolerans]
MAQSEEQNNESYSANPNQKVYDTPHVVDHLVDVIAIYFAEKKRRNLNGHPKKKPIR